MNILPLPLQHCSLIAILAILFLLTTPVPQTKASGLDSQISYELAISFDLDKQQLNGTAHLIIPAHRELTLYLDKVTPTGIMFKNASTPRPDLTAAQSDHIRIPKANAVQEVFLSFAKQVKDHHDNFITAQGIALLSNWYPIPSSKVLFSLKATVPNGFVALSESDFLADSASENATFNFSEPTTTIHFIAGPYVVDSREVRDGLSVHTYFLPEDEHLSDGYLESARAFILRYEEMIGKFPYNHFVIAENLRPTGYGMPTFTLLGKYVIRLPFIKDTSLGHEILHCWFGNSISVDYAQGNWSEGLTSYLADWLYREDDGEGALNRKEQLLKYHSYVDKENAIPLSAFTSASHNQPMANSIRSVGYIKGAMFFHELQNLIGEHLFFQAIKKFYSNFRHKTAGWSDIQKTFEEVSGEDLERFFSERLQSDDITNLEIKDLEVSTIASGRQLNFTIHQKSTTPFQLTLPLQIDAPNWSVSVLRRIADTTEKVSIPLKSLPSKITIDPDYDLMRTLEVSEASPTLAHFLGPGRPFVVAEESGATDYSQFLEYSSARDWQLSTMENLQPSEMNSSDLVLVGKENGIALSLFGPDRSPLSGMTIEARRHPLDDTKSILLVSASSAEEIRRTLPKLRHYGKYSYLHFQGGVLIEKRFSAEPFGYTINLSAEPKSLPTKELQSYSDSMAAMLPAQVIYLGESHTAMQDHYLQLLVIERLVKEKHDFAIGMEMFPESSQKVLDEYILGTSGMDEKTFLKRSRYFQVWNYDYRYYKEIIDLARKHKIPLIGLNIEREIVSSIFKNGSTSQLSEKQRSLLPKERDLSIPGYFERLRDVHGHHAHGGGNDGLGGFIQAQGVWDEVMADNIASYLRSNPTQKMVVLAGAEHARKDNGIPPRVSRRIEVSQVVAMTINEGRTPAAELADYFFYLPPQELSPAGKIGISIEEIQKADETFLKIVTLSPGSNAGKSGLLSGDIIVEANGVAIKNMEDLRIAIAGKGVGENISMKVRRGFDQSEKEFDLDVALYNPADAPQTQKTNP